MKFRDRKMIENLKKNDCCWTVFSLDFRSLKLISNNKWGWCKWWVQGNEGDGEIQSIKCNLKNLFCFNAKKVNLILKKVY